MAEAFVGVHASPTTISINFHRLAKNIIPMPVIHANL
jgi:hypothetical protein